MFSVWLYLDPVCDGHIIIFTYRLYKFSALVWVHETSPAPSLWLEDSSGSSFAQISLFLCFSISLNLAYCIDSEIYYRITGTLLVNRVSLHTTLLEKNLDLISSFVNYIYLFVFYVYMKDICMCTMQIPKVYGGHKRALDLLELELQAPVSPHVGVTNRTWFFARAASTLNFWTISLGPKNIYRISLFLLRGHWILSEIQFPGYMEVIQKYLSGTLHRIDV